MERLQCEGIWQFLRWCELSGGNILKSDPNNWQPHFLLVLPQLQHLPVSSGKKSILFTMSSLSVKSMIIPAFEVYKFNESIISKKQKLCNTNTEKVLALVLTNLYWNSKIISIFNFGNQKVNPHSDLK